MCIISVDLYSDLIWQTEQAFFFLNFIYLFIYLWLCWVFVSVRGLSLVAASRGHSSSRCAGLSLSRPLLLRSTGSRRAGSVVVAHGPSCFVACGIFPDQGSNPCPLHWQADSQPLRHQGSPEQAFLSSFFPHKKTKAQLRCGNNIKECFFEKLMLLPQTRKHIRVPGKQFQALLCMYGISSMFLRMFTMRKRPVCD